MSTSPVPVSSMRNEPTRRKMSNSVPRQAARRPPLSETQLSRSSAFRWMGSAVASDMVAGGLECVWK